MPQSKRIPRVRISTRQASALKNKRVVVVLRDAAIWYPGGASESLQRGWASWLLFVPGVDPEGGGVQQPKPLPTTLENPPTPQGWGHTAVE